MTTSQRKVLIHGELSVCQEMDCGEFNWYLRTYIPERNSRAVFPMNLLNNFQALAQVPTTNWLVRLMEGSSSEAGINVDNYATLFAHSVFLREHKLQRLDGMK